jgi:hypothetical protein
MTHDRWMSLATQTEIPHWHDTMADDYSEFEDELQQDQSQPEDDEEAEDLNHALSEEIAALKPKRANCCAAASNSYACVISAVSLVPFTNRMPSGRT